MVSPWCTPGIVAVDIELRERFGVAIQRPVLGVGERLLLAEATQVGLATPGGSVAGGAANEAAIAHNNGNRLSKECRWWYVVWCAQENVGGLPLAVPKARLSIVALVPRDVRALLCVHTHEGINGVA